MLSPVMQFREMPLSGQVRAGPVRTSPDLQAADTIMDPSAFAEADDCGIATFDYVHV